MRRGTTADPSCPLRIAGIGQPLSLLVKQNPAVKELRLFDVVPVVKGVAADVSHVDTPAVTTGYVKDEDGLKHALKGADIVIIPAGVPRKVSRRPRSCLSRLRRFLARVGNGRSIASG